MGIVVNNESGAGAVKGRALAEVEADVAQAVKGLEALRGEREALAEDVEAATANFDAARLEELERRAQALPVRTAAAQARLFRLYAERARVQLPEAEEQARRAKAEYDRAHVEYLAAHRLTNRFGVESDNARARLLSLRQAVEENERRAQEFSRRPQASPKGAQERRP
jgi:FtsZ-binding cell division protein ZapB